MLAAPRVIAPLRVLLVLAAAFALALLVGIPWAAADGLRREPALAPEIWPVAIVAELGDLGFLLVILCTWRLLSMVKHDRIFTEAAMRWVNLIVRTFVAGWVLLCVLAVYLTALLWLTSLPGSPAAPIALFGAVVLGAVLVMIVAVLRVLLRRATAMRQDLEEVI